MNMMISYQELVRTFPKCIQNVKSFKTIENHSLLGGAYQEMTIDWNCNSKNRNNLLLNKINRPVFCENT